jgi:hypothetical protein
MNTDKIKIDTEKVVDKVYHIKELHAIIEDIITDYINQVVLMDDKELKDDRSEWIKDYGRDELEDADMKYHTSIHTLALEIEQLRRWGEIFYRSKRQITEK